MTHILWMIFLLFWRILLPILGFFSLLWSPYVFWVEYRKTRDVGAAVTATVKMLFAAWTIEPVLIASFIVLGAMLIPLCIIPVLGAIMAAKILKAYADWFNRVNVYFHLPGTARVSLVRPRIHYHGWDSSDSIGDPLDLASDLHDSMENTYEAVTDAYGFLDDSIGWQAEPPVESVTPLQHEQPTLVTWQETGDGRLVVPEQIFIREHRDE